MRHVRTIRLLPALATVALATLHFVAAPAGAATPVGPNAGIWAGGYTLVRPGAPNVEANRARVEFALRLNQTDGTVYGKPVTFRSTGSTTVALDGYSGNRYVARSWTLQPSSYPGIPAYPGNGALIERCGIQADGDVAVLRGSAAVALVDGAGTEHPTALSFVFEVALRDPSSKLAGRNGIMSSVVQVSAGGAPTASPLPFALPGGGGVVTSLASGVVAVGDGPAPGASLCPGTEPVTTPRSLAASPDASGVTLSWLPPTDGPPVDRYRVFVEGSPAGTSTDTSLRVSLAPEHGYVLGVEALDAAGAASGRRSIAVYLHDTTIPSTPPDVTAVPDGTGVTFSWGPSTDDTGILRYGYGVEDVLGGFSAQGGTAPDVRSVHLALRPLRTYIFFVNALDQAFNGSSSSTVTLYVPDLAPPTAPTDLRVLFDTSSGGFRPYLRWAESTDNVRVLAYRIMIDGADIDSTSGITYDLAGRVPCGPTHTLTVMGFDAAGNFSVPATTTYRGTAS